MPAIHALAMSLTPSVRLHPAISASPWVPPAASPIAATTNAKAEGWGGGEDRDQDEPGEDGGNIAPVIDVCGIAPAVRSVAPVARGTALVVHGIAPVAPGVAPVVTPCATLATPIKLCGGGVDPCRALLLVRFNRRKRFLGKRIVQYFMLMGWRGGIICKLELEVSVTNLHSEGGAWQ